MEIKVNTEGKKTTLSLDGWLDTETAPELGAAIEELPEGTEELIIDFSKVEYVSSAGIRQLVAAHKKMGGNLLLANVSAEVVEVLNLTGVTKRIKFA